MKKFFGVAPANRTTIPSAKAAVGFDANEKPFNQWLNQAIYETQVDYIIGTDTQVGNNEANVKIVTGSAFQDALGSTVTFTQGDRIAIIGHDALDSNLVFSANDLVFMMNPDKTIDLASTYNFQITGTGARGNLNFTNAFNNSIRLSATSFLDVKTDFNGSISTDGDVIENGNLSNDLQGGLKNWLYGNFEVWQRGTSFVSATTGYKADRFFTTITGTVDVTRQSSGSPIGSQYYAKFLNQAAASKATNRQALESANVDRIKGKTITISCLVRAGGSFVPDLVLKLEKNATADVVTTGTWSTIASSTLANADIPTGTTSADWARISVTATVPDDGTANGLSWYLEPSTTGAASEYYGVAQTQLEIGGVSADFEHRPIALELKLCKRYYNQFTDDNLFLAGVIYAGGASSRMSIALETEMRISPSFSYTSANFWVGGITGFETIVSPAFKSGNIITINGFQTYTSIDGASFEIVGLKLDAEL